MIIGNFILSAEARISLPNNVQDRGVKVAGFELRVGDEDGC